MNALEFSEAIASQVSLLQVSVRREVWRRSPFNPDYEANMKAIEKEVADRARNQRISELEEELRYLKQH